MNHNALKASASLKEYRLNWQEVMAPSGVQFCYIAAIAYRNLNKSLLLHNTLLSTKCCQSIVTIVSL